MITTVTLNPMLDKTVDVDRVRIGGITRASAISMVVGGKGVNVARQLRLLGTAATAAGFLGGETGTMLERFLDAEGIPRRFVRVAGLTREGVTYRHGDGTQTAVFEPPHTVTSDEARALVRLCGPLLDESSWLVCGGSSPSADADGTYRELIALAHARGVRTVLDCYGRAFTLGMEAGPTVVKPNREEYARSFGRKLRRRADIVRALDHLLSMRVRVALITGGGGPCFAAAGTRKWRIIPPRIRAVNPTGSGDSMIAGLLHGFEQGWELTRCLAFSAAAGAANARVWQVACSSLEEIMTLMPKVRLEEIG